MIHRLRDFMDRVTGDANGETGTCTTVILIWVMQVEDIPQVGRGNIVRTKMNTVGSDCNSNIGPGVDEQVGGRRRIVAYSRYCFAGKQFQFAGNQIFLAELDEIHAASSGFGNLLEQTTAAGRLVAGELASVGDIAKKQGNSLRICLCNLRDDFSDSLGLQRTEVVFGQAITQIFESFLG